MSVQMIKFCHGCKWRSEETSVLDPGGVCPECGGGLSQITFDKSYEADDPLRSGKKYRETEALAAHLVKHGIDPVRSGRRVK